MKMINKNRLYLVTFTSGDQWEMSKGIIVVSAIDRAKARKVVQRKIGGQDILTIKLIKPTKAGILFTKDVVIQ